MKKIYFILLISLFLYSSSNLGVTIAQCAYEQIGKPYAVGSLGPYAFDDFGLVYYCLKKAGIYGYIDRKSQAKQGTIIDRTELAPGDNLYSYDKRFNLIGALIYIGNSKVIFCDDKEVVIDDIGNLNYNLHYDYRRCWS